MPYTDGLLEVKVCNAIYWRYFYFCANMPKYRKSKCALGRPRNRDPEGSNGHFSFREVRRDDLGGVEVVSKILVCNPTPYVCTV